MIPVKISVAALHSAARGLATTAVGALYALGMYYPADRAWTQVAIGALALLGTNAIRTAEQPAALPVKVQ
jgi:hypothetical protein